MSRWDPGSEDRLRRAALDLFTEHGYDAVTAADIAARAGLTRRSFFRRFPDKREVLFGDSSRLLAAIEDGIGQVGDSSPRDAVIDVLAHAGTTLLGLADQPRRQRVIQATPELQERERTKTGAIGTAVARGLAAHDLPADEAALLGSVIAEVFRVVYAKAALDSDGTPFSTAFREAVDASGLFLQPRTP